jgi:hypothetical protein
MDTHFSNVSRNSTGKRIPTASGAIGTNINKALIEDVTDDSPNKGAVDSKIKVEESNVLIARNFLEKFLQRL